MAKIDFGKLKVEARIDEFAEMDLRRSLANALFAEALTIEDDELARRIHKSEGAMELSQAEYGAMLDALRRAKVTLRIVKAIERSKVED